MHAGRHYSRIEVMFWTRRETAIFVAIATVPTLLFPLAGWTWLGVPWLPIALVGTAVAFITDFKNNASYGRLWSSSGPWRCCSSSSAGASASRTSRIRVSSRR